MTRHGASECQDSAICRPRQMPKTRPPEGDVVFGGKNQTVLDFLLKTAALE